MCLGRLVSTLSKFKLPTNNNISTELQEKRRRRRRRLRSALIPELQDYATNLSGHLGKLSQANTDSESMELDGTQLFEQRKSINWY
ncbi:hypothetical protein ACLB2K_003737 [Fragaria x ananassa]